MRGTGVGGVELCETCKGCGAHEASGEIAAEAAGRLLQRLTLGKKRRVVMVRAQTMEKSSATHTTESTRKARSWSLKNSKRKKRMPTIIGTKTSDSSTCEKIRGP
jgi:hypothetical protein